MLSFVPSHYPTVTREPFQYRGRISRLIDDPPLLHLTEAAAPGRDNGQTRHR
jgi:hypothetical protein